MSKKELITEISKIEVENMDALIEKVLLISRVFCDHGKIKKFCSECNGYNCIHDKYKYRCKECGGSQICEHNNQRQQCRECRGSQICKHRNQKNACRICRIPKN